MDGRTPTIYMSPTWLLHVGGQYDMMIQSCTIKAKKEIIMCMYVSGNQTLPRLPWCLPLFFIEIWPMNTISINKPYINLTKLKTWNLFRPQFITQKVNKHLM